MNKLAVMTLALAMVMGTLVAAEGEAKADGKNLGYAMGSHFAGQMSGQIKFLKEKGEEIDVDSFIEGFSTVLKGGKPSVSKEDAMATLQAMSKRMQAKQAASKAVAGAQNKGAGIAFLEANKVKKGVITTASGLQYTVLKDGKGAKPKATDKVKVHYRGTTLDGAEFDSSYSRGTPAEFAANRVIAGWTEALQLMPVGSKYKLFIPSELAYGSRGAGPKIGPDAALIFEVELLEILQ